MVGSCSCAWRALGTRVGSSDTGHKARPYARCHYALGNLAHYDAAAVLDAGGLALIVKAPVLH